MVEIHAKDIDSNLVNNACIFFNTIRAGTGGSTHASGHAKSWYKILKGNM
jgi:hypothetical protein